MNRAAVGSRAPCSDGEIEWLQLKETLAPHLDDERDAPPGVVRRHERCGAAADIATASPTLGCAASAIRASAYPSVVWIDASPACRIACSSGIPASFRLYLDIDQDIIHDALTSELDDLGEFLARRRDGRRTCG